jgi:hypothetical protein
MAVKVCGMEWERVLPANTCSRDRRCHGMRYSLFLLHGIKLFILSFFFQKTLDIFCPFGLPNACQHDFSNRGKTKFLKSCLILISYCHVWSGTRDEINGL